MAEAASPKRPPWFWPVVAVVVLVLAIGGFAAPSVLECSGSQDGFGTCMTSKLADLGLVDRPVTEEPAQQTAVAVAQPADSAETPAPVVTPPDFGVRVEPDGSILIAGTGALGKTVEIYVNGELYGTADVDSSGDWVLVPDAPLPPGGYELTLVDPDTKQPLDKSYVVAINEDLTSEPLIVASESGEASDILQGLRDTATEIAEANVPEIAPATEPEPEPVSDDVQIETVRPEVAHAETSAVDAAEVETAEAEVAPAAPLAEVQESQPDSEDAADATEIASAEPVEDVIDDVAALQERIEALEAMAPPSIEAVEIDNGRNYFAGTGADGAIIRLYVDNVYVGDTEVVGGNWLLETDDVLKNRSQRVRVDQLMPGSADVASRAEIDFIFEEPVADPAETVVAEAPEPVVQPEVDADADAAETPEPADQSERDSDTVVAEDVPADSEQEIAAVVDAEAVAAVEDVTTPVDDTSAKATTVKTTTAEANVAQAPVEEIQEPVAASDQPATGEASSSVSGASAATAVASAAGSVVALPEPDFSIDTGIPVAVVSVLPDAEIDPAPVAEPDTPVVVEPEPVVADNAASETDDEDASSATVVAEIAPEPEVSQADVPQLEVPKLVAMPVGAPELGRFATGKAIIRSGDNLWTIARRVYGSGYRYTQIYGANRDQIRNPDLIYPGQVFALPKVVGETETASQ